MLRPNAGGRRWCRRPNRKRCCGGCCGSRRRPILSSGALPAGEPLHYRTLTPWDFRNRYRIRSFDIWPDAAGQPLVRWRSDVVDLGTGADLITEGHVEIRWSHGRFAGNPEAKIYLDTPHHQVAGYQSLGSPISTAGLRQLGN